MLRTLLAIFRPLTTIARELHILRELYEADLATRQIYRLTEKPAKDDTSVSYAGMRDERPQFKKWFDAAEEDDVQQ